MSKQAGPIRKTALYELADVSIDSELTDKVDKAAKLALTERNLSKVEIRGVQGVKSGQNIMVEIDVGASGDLSVVKINEIEAAIRETVGRQVRGVRRVIVHFSSANKKEPAFLDEFIARSANDSDPESSDDDDHKGSNGHAALPSNANGSTRKRT